MAETNLTQAEADALLQMEKHRVDDRVWSLADNHGKVRIPLKTIASREEFVLSLWRGGIELRKGNYNNLARKVVTLARLDFGGAPHANPDGETIPCPHLHVYREGYADKWARPLDIVRFHDHADSWTMLDDFMTYCNITEPPRVERMIT
jgi:hypothetical protein